MNEGDDVYQSLFNFFYSSFDYSSYAFSFIIGFWDENERKTKKYMNMKLVKYFHIFL